MKKIAGKVTDIDFFPRKSTLPTCPTDLINMLVHPITGVLNAFGAAKTQSLII